MEYYSAIKKNEIMPFAATWMDLEIVILSEVSQTDLLIIQIQISYDTAFMWNLKYDLKNLSMKQKQTQKTGLENRLVVAKGEGWTGSLGLADANYYI